jgi:hypothetical protein
MEQLAIFDVEREDTIFNVMDVRTDRQENKKISYDVGETIGGSKKSLYERKQRFLSVPTEHILAEIENEDVATAAELVTKDVFFAWFSLEDAKERGVEAPIAKGIQLLIQRIDKSPADHPEERKKYTIACLFLSKLFKETLTRSDFKAMSLKMSRLYSASTRNEEYCRKCIKSDEESLKYEFDPAFVDYLTQRIEKYQELIELIQYSSSIHLHSLGTKLKNYFCKGSSNKSTNATINSVSSWDDLLKPVKKETTRSVAKKVWERELPERPDRHGGKIISVEKPEEFTALFNFKATEFGHYMEDAKGREHLLRSTEGYSDLADLLEIPMDKVSLANQLSMAFGSRGRGRALGHYEPGFKVINLTKERGSLGILAHEWFHALDHFIYNVSHDHQNGKVGYMTMDKMGSSVDVLVNRAVQDLVQAMTEGESEMEIDVSKSTTVYKISNSDKLCYERHDGNLCDIMDEMISAYDERIARYKMLYSENYRKSDASLIKKRNMVIKKEAVFVAQLHFAMTGEKVNTVPYTSDQSQFLTTSIKMDKFKKGKYWSSIVELSARAFEAYIFDELKERGWRSDYLVCGVRDSCFPQGEERVNVNNAIRNLMNTIKVYL